MPDIFVSYKSEDRDFAEDLKRRVEDWGYSTWWDQDIKAGENYVRRIREELEAARAVIVVLTTRAIGPAHAEKSDSFVLAEAAWARPKKALIPVVVPPLEAEQLPPPFNHLQSLRWADSERIHVELRKHAIQPENLPVEKPAFRQDVFTTSIPTYTEVDRSRTREYQDLQANLRMKGRIVRLHGPTQCGKTVLARRAQAGLMPIELKGVQIQTRSDFFDAIAAYYAPEIPTDAREFRVTRFLVDSARPVIIDDFHRIPVKTQEAIIEVGKGLIESGVNLVLISIPDSAEALIGNRPEFRNRSVSIKAPRWSALQLRQIPALGFRRLKMLVHPQVIDEVIHQAHGNPQLVQDYCYRICESERVLETFPVPTPIPIRRTTLVEIFRGVGATRNYDLMPILQSLGENAQKVRWGLDGRRVSLPAVILIVLDRKGGFQPLTPTTIATNANRIIAYPDRRHVTPESILAAGRDLIDQLHTAGYFDSVIGQEQNKFFIEHADFKVHLHWKLAPQLTGIQPQLEKFTSEHNADEIMQKYQEQQ